MEVESRGDARTMVSIAVEIMDTVCGRECRNRRTSPKEIIALVLLMFGVATDVETRSGIHPTLNYQTVDTYNRLHRTISNNPTCTCNSINTFCPHKYTILLNTKT
jgi:hypothetical protein